MRTRLPHTLAALVAAVSLGLAAAPVTAHAKPAHGNNGGGKHHNKGGKHDKHDKKDSNLVGPFKKKDYPVSARLRPLVLPNQMGQIGVDFDASKAAGVVDVTGTATDGTSSSTALGLNVNFDYGIGGRFDFGASTGLLLSPATDWTNGLGLRAHYLSYDTKQLDFAPGLLLPLSFAKGAGLAATVDLPARYVLDNGLFLRFGQGAIPIGLSPDFSLTLVGNGGLGYQVVPAFELFVDTSLVAIRLTPDADFTGIWDTLIFDLGGQYSPTKDWDIGARLNGSNVWKVDNSFYWSLALFGNYRF
jgi:hypothetical protein